MAGAGGMLLGHGAGKIETIGNEALVTNECSIALRRYLLHVDVRPHNRWRGA
jgi:hypothetical protein